MCLERMIADADKILRDIHAHPFNQELSNGSLKQEIFQYYLHQDAQYLSQFSVALQAIAERLPEQHKALFTQLSAYMLASERWIHDTYLTRYAKTSRLFAAPTTPPINRVCQDYIQHLLEKAKSAHLAIAIASVLPCGWVYWELGKQMIPNVGEKNPYAEWIMSYGCKEFSDAVETIKNVLNHVAQSVGPEIESAMREAFLQSAQFECDFFHAAYNHAHVDASLNKTRHMAGCR